MAMPAAAQPNLTSDAELRRLRTLYGLLAALTRARGLDEIYEAAITSLLSATEADRAAILVFDDDDVIRFKAWRGLSAEYREAVTGHTPWPKGAVDAQPVAIADVLAEESLQAYRDAFDRERIRALVFIPLALEEVFSGNSFSITRSLMSAVPRSSQSLKLSRIMYPLLPTACGRNSRAR